MTYLDYIRRKRQAESLKECTCCHLDKPLSAFSKRSAWCKSCAASRYVTCLGCHTKKLESEMDIYYVVDDKYACNQQCADKAHEVKRNKKGLIYILKDEHGKWRRFSEIREGPPENNKRESG